MKLKSILAGLAISVASTTGWAAACTSASTTSLGQMGPPGFSSFGNSFSSTGTYVDCFTFSLSNDAKSFGGALSLDPLWNKLDIALQSVSLYSTDKFYGTSSNPLLFSFGNLAGGNAMLYTLELAINVSRASGFIGRLGTNDKVGYAGVITTLASPAPEPAAYALVIAGFAIVGASAWRRRRP